MRFTIETLETQAREALPTLAPKAALEHLLAQGRPKDAPPRWSACVSTSPELIPADYHPFVAAAQLAFAEHRPLRFGPDEFWLVLSQGFANHIGLNAQALRDRFVQHEGKKKLVVRRDDFVLDAPDNPWHEVIDSFCDQIKDHVQSRYALMIGDFSTTTPIARTASCVTMMDALQSYFEYELRTLCGIPEFELTGSSKDWEELRRKVAALEEFDLGWWTCALAPILDELVATSQGQVNQEFWRSFFKFNGQSGGPFIHGWISHLFPYLRQGDKLQKNPYLVDQEHNSGPTSDQFPGALSCAPVMWEYHGASIPMQFLGGFFGIAQAQDRTLSADIGWAVTRAPEPSL